MANIFAKFRLPWKPYSTEEITLLENIQKVWTRYHKKDEGNMPVHFKWDPDSLKGGIYKPQVNPSTVEFLPTHFTLSNGALQHEAREILGIICEYQMEKVKRENYNNDPWHLLLEELKTFVVNLSAADITVEDVYDLLNKEKQFVRACWVELFPPSHDNNMRVTLFDVEEQLNVALTKAYRGFTNTCAKVKFAQITRQIESLLSHCLQFAYYTLRNDMDLPNFSVQQIRNASTDSRSKYAAVLTSRLGKLLAYILKTPIFCCVYSENVPRQIGGYTSTSIEIRLDENPILAKTATRKFQLPIIFDDKNAHKITPATFLEDGTVEKDLCNEELSLSVLNLHVFIFELGKLCVFCSETESLAEVGGDLLTYGVANAQVLRILQICNHLSVELRQTINAILRKTENYLRTLVHKGSDSKNSTWFSNYTRIYQSLDTIELQFKAVDKLTSEIQQITLAVSLKERLLQAQLKTERFIANAQLFASHASRIFGISFQENNSTILAASSPLLQHSPTNRQPNNVKPTTLAFFRQDFQTTLPVLSALSGPVILELGHSTFSIDTFSALLDKLKLYNVVEFNAKSLKGPHKSFLASLLHFLRESRSTIRVLDISEWDIGDDDLESITNTLVQIPTIETLYLEGTKLTENSQSLVFKLLSVTAMIDISVDPSLTYCLSLSKSCLLKAKEKRQVEN